MRNPLHAYAHTTLLMSQMLSAFVALRLFVSVDLNFYHYRFWGVSRGFRLVGSRPVCRLTAVDFDIHAGQFRVFIGCRGLRGIREFRLLGGPMTQTCLRLAIIEIAYLIPCESNSIGVTVNYVVVNSLVWQHIRLSWTYTRPLTSPAMRYYWGTWPPSTSNNIFLSANFRVHKVWQRLCAVASPNIFTARRSYASAVLGVLILSVCPSVRLSVCLTHALWLIQRTYRRYFYTAWKGNPSSFLPPNSGWWATSASI